MTQAAQRVDMEKLVHRDVDDGACCRGLFVIKLASSAQFHSPSFTGQWILQKRRTENETLEIAHIFYYIFL